MLTSPTWATGVPLLLRHVPLLTLGVDRPAFLSPYLSKPTGAVVRKGQENPLGAFQWNHPQDNCPHSQVRTQGAGN